MTVNQTHLSAAAPRRHGRRLLLVTTVSAALLGFGLAGGATANAAPADLQASVSETSAIDQDMNVMSSRGFTVNNLSDYTLKLVRIDGNNLFEGRPDIGTTITPGGSQRFEVTYWYLYNQRNDAVYDVLDDSGNTVGTFTAKMGVMSADSWGPATRYADCTSTTGTCTHDAENITFLNAAGTVRTITDGQAQAEVLNQWCNESSTATCSFDVKSKSSFLSGAHQSGPGYGNGTDIPITKKLTTTEKVGVTQNVEVSASTKVSIAKIVEVSVNAKYGRSWVNEHTFTDETSFALQPHKFYWPVSENPMIRYTGDFTVKVGNTTWKLLNVSFDVPDADGYASVTWKQRDLTPALAASAPSITDAPTTSVSTYGDVFTH